MNQKFLIKSINIYYCGHELCQGGHFYGPAVRPHNLVHFILKGKGQYFVNGETYSLKQGDAFLIRPNETTYYIADDREPWEYAWVAFGGSDVDALLNMCSFSKDSLVFISKQTTTSKEYSDNILNLIRIFHEDHYNEPALLSCFYSVFSRMVKKETNNIYNTKELFYKEACYYIHQNYSYDIHINGIASFIGINRTYLYKIFMDMDNISPKQYLIQYRLQVATNMLYDTNMSITEIAISCGFRELTSFTRLFTKYKGVSPSQFRKTLVDFS